MATDSERIEALKEQIAAKQAQIRQIRARDNGKERKNRNHVAMVIGGLVLSHAPGKDWKRLDLDRLAAWLDQYGYKIEQCGAPSLPREEAYERVKAWEKAKRGDNAAKEPQPSSAPLPQDGQPSSLDAPALGGGYGTQGNDEQPPSYAPANWQ